MSDDYTLHIYKIVWKDFLRTVDVDVQAHTINFPDEHRIGNTPGFITFENYEDDEWVTVHAVSAADVLHIRRVDNAKAAA